MQIDKASLLPGPRQNNLNTQVAAERKPVLPGSGEIHDRLPAYYTALATSRSAPWVQSQSDQHVINKLPAYLTDGVPADVDIVGGSSGKLVNYLPNIN